MTLVLVFVPFNFISASFWSGGRGWVEQLYQGNSFFSLCSETSEVLQYTATEAEDVEKVRV